MSAPDHAVLDLYHNHAAELRRFVRRRLGPQEAEDIVQDTYVQMLQRGPGSMVASPRAYLFTIAANLTVDHMRRAGTRPSHCELDDADFAIGGGDFSMEVRSLQDALSELPASCREAFLLHRLMGLNYPQIAAQLGVSVRTIDRYMIRAWRHVRQKTGRDLQPPERGALSQTL